MIPKVKDRVIEIQEKIAACLSIKTDQLVFEFNEMPDYVDLDLFTINAVHKQQFFFHSTEGRDKIEALELRLRYASQSVLLYVLFFLTCLSKPIARLLPECLPFSGLSGAKFCNILYSLAGAGFV